jgi:hypothetical protein
VVGYHFTLPWRWRQLGALKHWYLTTALHSITTQKTPTWNTTTLKALKLTSDILIKLNQQEWELYLIIKNPHFQWSPLALSHCTPRTGECYSIKGHSPMHEFSKTVQPTLTFFLPEALPYLINTVMLSFLRQKLVKMWKWKPLQLKGQIYSVLCRFEKMGLTSFQKQHLS